MIFNYSLLTVRAYMLDVARIKKMHLVFSIYIYMWNEDMIHIHKCFKSFVYNLIMLYCYLFVDETAGCEFTRFQS